MHARPDKKTHNIMLTLKSKYCTSNNWEIISAQEADHQALSKIRLFLSGKFKLIVFIYISLKDLNKSRNINIANVVDTIRPEEIDNSKNML